MPRDVMPYLSGIVRLLGVVHLRLRGHLTAGPYTLFPCCSKLTGCEVFSWELNMMPVASDSNVP
jgi:hypothetical protein